MTKLIMTRVVRLIATLLAVSFITFVMVSLLPGDAIDVLLPPDAPRTPEVLDQLKAEYRLDDPVLVRYFDWLGDAVRGDLGQSFISDQAVSDIIKDRIPITAELALLATLIALALALPIGIIGAFREGRPADKVTGIAAQVGLSVPNFIVAIFAIWLFTIQWKLLPSSGWNRLSEDGLIENLKSAILPSITLALAPMAIYSRLLRGDMINVLKEDYVLSAKAKGLKTSYILARHALRPSSLSLMTVVGIQIGALLGGTVVIEQIFAVPGLGRRLIEAINQRDVIVIQGITVFIASIYVIINTIVDLLYLVVDPRIRKG